MTVSAILFGRKGSTGMPGKNTMAVSGRPCCEYPMRAAVAAKTISRLYVSTDDPAIAALGGEYDAHIISRPSDLCRADTSLEDAIHHAFLHVMADIPAECLVLLQANQPCVTPDAIDRAVRLLEADPGLDSVATVAEMSAFAPYRARRLEGGRLVAEVAGNPDSKGDRAAYPTTYFCDGAVYAVRPAVLSAMSSQPGPYRWQGRNIGMVEQAPSTGDIDHKWQIPVIEWWLQQHAVS